MPIVAEEQRKVNHKNSSNCLWNVNVIDTTNGEAWQLWANLTKREVLSRLRLWDEHKTECVLVPYPQWLPEFKSHSAGCDQASGVNN